MKRLYYFILFLTAIYFSSGCVEETFVEEQVRSGIKVCADLCETRTTYTSANGVTSVSWVAGDKIGLCTDKQENLCYIADESGKSTNFSARGTKLDAQEGDIVYAYYKYEQRNFPGNKSFRLPSTSFQSYPGEASVYDYLYAKGEVHNNEVKLRFKHVFAFLRVTLPTKLLVKDNASGSYMLRFISDEQLSIIEDADENSIVFMHHPFGGHKGETNEKLKTWRKKHSKTMLFYGHRHLSFAEGYDVCLQALDPEKAIGENPCITYFNTETRELRKAYYFSPVPNDLYRYFGISCFDVERDIGYAIANKLSCLELRPDCLKMGKARLFELVKKWRNVCGKNLSIHLPDVAYKDGLVVPSEQLDELIDLAVFLKADRFTQHVPRVSVKVTKEDGCALDRICNFLCCRCADVRRYVRLPQESRYRAQNLYP